MTRNHALFATRVCQFLFVAHVEIYDVKAFARKGYCFQKKRGLQCAKNSHAAFGLVSKLKFMASRKRTWNNRTIGRFESLSGGSQFQGTMVRPEEVVNRCCFALLRGWWAWFPRHEN